MISWPGFAAQMVRVEWLVENAESLSVPRFDEHNGQSAKRRATETQRKREARSVCKVSASGADKSGPEKRREEKIYLPPYPFGEQRENADRGNVCLTAGVRAGRPGRDGR